MVHIIHERFLEDSDEYQAAEDYWVKLAKGVAKELGVEEWKSWISRSYADGTPWEQDGNPIFSARSEELERGVRVMQHTPTSDDIEIAAWLKNYPEEFIDLPRDELVINIGLSEESGEKARQLLRIWMSPQSTPGEMQDAIEHLLPQQ
jgi:hypothetical protein